MTNRLYIFLDEGGNFDFSPNGTRYFTLTAVSLTRPFQFVSALTELKYDMLELGHDLEYFHAAKDKQDVRNQVFDIILRETPEFRIDTIVVDKRKANPKIQNPERLYPMMVRYLLQYVCYPPNIRAFPGIIIITDKIPVKRHIKAIEKAIKTTLPAMLSNDNQNYEILHHQAKSSFALQVTDYVNWAIYRKWDRDDFRSYDLIKHRIRSEFDIFRKGTTVYY